MTIRSILVFSLMVSGLGGCGIIKDKAVDYKKTSSSPTLEVPPDLVLQREDDMQIPETGVTYTGYETQPSPAQRNTSVLPQPDNIQLLRNNQVYWLSVQAEPAALWNKVKQFWLENGFELTRNEPRVGLLETSWLENRANIPEDIVRRTIGKALDFLYASGTRDMYRIRLERGEKAGSTEIYVSHRGVAQVTQGDVFVWQPRPADPELELEMLKRLMVYLGLTEQGAQQQAAAVGTPAGNGVQALASMQQSAAGQPVIVVRESLGDAWRRVGLGLDRANFTVEDRDRAAGDYFVRYMGPAYKEDPGFFSKLAFWRDDPKATERLYLVHLSEQGSATQVELWNESRQPEQAELADKILRILLENLEVK